MKIVVTAYGFAMWVGGDGLWDNLKNIFPKLVVLERGIWVRWSFADHKLVKTTNQKQEQR